MKGIRWSGAAGDGEDRQLISTVEAIRKSFHCRELVSNGIRVNAVADVEQADTVRGERAP